MNTATFANADIKHVSRQILWKAIHSSDISEATKLLLPNFNSLAKKLCVISRLCVTANISQKRADQYLQLYIKWHLLKALFLACEASISMFCFVFLHFLLFDHAEIGMRAKYAQNPTEILPIHWQFLTNCAACLWSPFEVFIFLIAALWNARSNSDPKSLGENPSVFFTNELNWE